MITLYNSFAKVFGDNKKGKRIYKLSKLIVPAIVLLLFLYKLFSVPFTIRSLLVLMVWAGIFAVYYRNVFKDKMENLHAFPDIRGVSMKGVKIRYEEPNREKMFKITFPNDCLLEASYEKGEYHIRVKNDEWAVINEAVIQDINHFKPALISAMELANSQPMPPEKENDLKNA